MAAKAQKQVAAFLQRGKEIEAPQLRQEPFPVWPEIWIIKLGQAYFSLRRGGHDAHHTLVPLMVSQDQGVPLLRRHLLDHGNGLGIDLLLHGLPLAV